MIDSRLNSVIPAVDLDYADVDEICGYQQLLCKLYELAGGFAARAGSNPAIREARVQGDVWLKSVEVLIEKTLTAPDSAEGITLGAVPRLLDAYDLLCRVCRGAPARDFIRKARLRAADLWAKGNRSISQTNVVLGILREVSGDNRALEGRYTRFALSVLGRWIDELTRYGRFHDIPPHEAYSRLACLLRTDLYGYLGSREQSGLKARWAKSYALSDDRLDSLSANDLRSYIAFVQTAALRGIVPLADSEETRLRLLAKLAARPDLHPFSREALELDLAQYQPA